MLTSQTDLVAEGLLSVTELRAMIPSSRLGRRINKSTIFRWITHGCHGIRLEAERIGGSYYTSRQAFDRFRAAMNRRNVPFTPSTNSTPANAPATQGTPRPIGHEAAMRQLAAAGI